MNKKISYRNLKKENNNLKKELNRVLYEMNYISIEFYLENPNNKIFESMESDYLENIKKQIEKRKEKENAK